MSFRALQPAIVALAAALFLGACASEPPDPMLMENTEELVATVTAINHDTRVVALRSDSGEVVTLQVAPDVRNLPQVKVGDQVIARYYASLGAEVINRGDASGETFDPETALAASRAARGDKPSGFIGREVAQSVRVTAIDKKNHVVSFYGSDGLARSAPVLSSEGQAFISKLKPGDEVALVYTEAVAVSVEPHKD